MVSVEPNTTRLPTDTPYNTFTITCTATAPEGVVAGKTIEWKRRIGPSTTGLTEITDNGDTIQIETTNLSQPESISVLTVTETTPGDYRYRCRVDIPEIDINDVDEDVYPIDVIGEFNNVVHFANLCGINSTSFLYDAGAVAPEQPINLMNTNNTTHNSSTIKWTVPQIAFTPEIYVAHYGTSNGSLNLMSGPVESGDDFEAENQVYMVRLNGLNPGVLYYYQVIATNTYNSTMSGMETFHTLDQRKSMCTFSLVFPLYLVSIIL